MKLIDILVEELPKRGGWAEGVEHAWCDPDGEIRFRNGGCEPDFYPDSDVDTKYRVPDPSFEDDSRYIITREQYEAALTAKNDGWIEWGGGECPVPGDTEVLVKCKSEGAWDCRCKQRADEVSWAHDDSALDVIAYRLHQPQQEERPEESEEDLNECIGQAVSAAWNGEGLPPVGCECERSWAGDKFLPCKIVFTSNQLVVVKIKGSGIEDAYYIGDVTFRPLRSEADKKRDAAIESIDWYMPEFIPDTPNELYHAKKIYDAIAAGKIPGVKLED